MAYPVLASGDTWFTQGCDASVKMTINSIEFADAFIPDPSATVMYSWDASASGDGSIKCYVIDTKLIIAGNGSGKIMANENSVRCFGTSYSASFLPVGQFKNVSSITGLTILDTSKVQRASMMFQGCVSLLTLDLTGWDTSSFTNTMAMFESTNKLTEIIGLSQWNVSNVTNMSSMFANNTENGSVLVSVGDLSSWDTRNVTNMSKMFKMCKRISGLDVSNWNTSSCTDMSNMFTSCSSLGEINVTEWDVSNVTNMSFMFYGCSSLKEIDVSNWDVSKVTNFDHFAAHANLKRKGIENWKTTSATNMNALFHNCAEEELDLSGWDVSKNQFFCQMFENSPNLKRIKGLDEWNTSAGLGFDEMFGRCSKLEEVDLSSFNTTNAKNDTSASTNGHKTATLKDMFASCSNLKKVTVGPNFAVNGNGSNTTAANKAILPTTADGYWYTFNGDSYASDGMKDKTAETYYSSYAAVADADVIVKNGSLIDVAKAIREKSGTTDKYTPAQFGDAIRSLT